MENGHFPVYAYNDIQIFIYRILTKYTTN